MGRGRRSAGQRGIPWEASIFGVLPLTRMVLSFKMGISRLIDGGIIPPSANECNATTAVAQTDVPLFLVPTASRSSRDPMVPTTLTRPTRPKQTEIVLPAAKRVNSSPQHKRTIVELTLPFHSRVLRAKCTFTAPLRTSQQPAFLPGKPRLPPPPRSPSPHNKNPERLEQEQHIHHKQPKTAALTEP